MKETESTSNNYEVTAICEAPKDALSEQVGGDHYKDMAIQPVEFITKNGIGFIEGSIIKYICRHKSKNGKQDLLKARHFIDLLIQLEYGNKD